MTEETTCIFCRIARGEIPATLVHEDDEIVAFEDVNPQAPVHVLVIPRRHVASASALEEGDNRLAGHLLLTAARIARARGIDDTGFRIVTNIGEDGGQSVPHLHLHVIGGRRMAWPPG